jgi:hypothetical protein
LRGFDWDKPAQLPEGGDTVTQRRDQAREFGLDRLTDSHLAQFERAASTMQVHVARLPRDLPVTQEPAHIYRAKPDEDGAAGGGRR